MRTWDDYKRHVKRVSDQDKRNMEEIEEAAAIVAALIKRRQELGLSQRALAERCGIPQSSVVRMETDENAAKVRHANQNYTGPRFKIEINRRCFIAYQYQALKSEFPI